MSAGSAVVVTLGGRSHQGVVVTDHGSLVTVTCSGRMVVTAHSNVQEV